VFQIKLCIYVTVNTNTAGTASHSPQASGQWVVARAVLASVYISLKYYSKWFVANCMADKTGWRSYFIFSLFLKFDFYFL
jgi:hypothetical protein